MKKGFTLIELLIVIAILGILALTLIVAIDPFEQLKKGRDTSTRNTTSEFYNAALRYYANLGVFPWGSSVVATDMWAASDYVTEFQTKGELKTNFLELLGSSNAAKIIVNSTATDHLAVCFSPESKSVDGEQNTQYASDGSIRADCISISGQTATDCYYCIQ